MPESRNPLHTVEKADAPLAHQGFPPGNADFLDPEGYGGAGHALQLFIPENFAVADLGDSLFRHAVPAAEVAAVGDRQTEIVDSPSMAIGHCHRFLVLLL
jgi:hypothetical protein